MNKFIRAIALLILALPVVAAPQKALVNKIDAASVTVGLPLIDVQRLKSGDGRTKQQWRIESLETGKFEVIGNNQNDADVIGWNCMQFDGTGAAISPALQNALCHRLFSRVLAKFTTVPDWFAKNLIADALASRTTQSRQLDDFVFETDGEFYFVRRLSRMKTR